MECGSTLRVVFASKLPTRSVGPHWERETADAERRATLIEVKLMEVKQRLQAIINETLTDTGREAVPTMTREMSLRKDLGLDSLELAVLTVKLEAEFGVDVFAGGLVNTIGQVEDKLHGG